MITTPEAYQAALTWQAQLNLVITAGDTSSLDPILVMQGPVWCQDQYNDVQLRINDYLNNNPDPTL